MLLVTWRLIATSRPWSQRALNGWQFDEEHVFPGIPYFWKLTPVTIVSRSICRSLWAVPEDGAVAGPRVSEVPVQHACTHEASAVPLELLQ